MNTTQILNFNHKNIKKSPYKQKLFILIKNNY